MEQAYKAITGHTFPYEVSYNYEFPTLPAYVRFE
jgi:hypothetical protein